MKIIINMRVNRRQALQVTLLGISSTLALSGLARSESVQIAADTNDPYAAEVDAGLAYFKDLATRQLPLVENLLREIRNGNVDRAKQAYLEARPPYEQIEVLAPSFEQTDSDIDARPYSFDGGEFDPEFKGFHKIEAFLFRDGETQAALPYTEELVESVKTLSADLDRRENFNSRLHFEGLIALATEIASKKISGEEETWSDRSLLIFRENWSGIYSQFEPFSQTLARRDAGAADAVRAAYETAQATIDPYFNRDRLAGEPYSSIDTQTRAAIVRSSYQLRDRLLQAMERLDLA
ncbi:MAG: EfeM/EfeO family lipoprotein [Cyanobacteria bacterium SBC]|nr:EfeM/EfeO family lipoprotein [Cyanobacteria bacterium SBC]